MTCIVAVSDGKKTLVAADRLLASCGGDGIPPECYTSETSKLWRDEEAGMVLGICGSLRLAQRLQREMPSRGDEGLWEWLVDPVATLVRQIKAEENVGPKSMLLVATASEIFTLTTFDLSVLTGDVYGTVCYSAIGAGRHWAYGSLRTSAVLGTGTLEDWARLALEAAAAHSPMVGGPPFDVLEIRTPLRKAELIRATDCAAPGRPRAARSPAARDGS